MNSSMLFGSNNLFHAKKKLTFSKHPVHVKPVCGTGLIVSTATDVYTELLHAFVLDHTDVSATNLICRERNSDIILLNKTLLKCYWKGIDFTLGSNRYNGNFSDVTVFAQLTVVFIHILKTCLIFQTKNKDDTIQPVAELWHRGRVKQIKTEHTKMCISFSFDGFVIEYVSEICTVIATHTCALGGPDSSRISNNWLCPSTSTSFLYRPPYREKKRRIILIWLKH